MRSGSDGPRWYFLIFLALAAAAAAVSKMQLDDSVALAARMFAGLCGFVALISLVAEFRRGGARPVAVYVTPPSCSVDERPKKRQQTQRVYL
jgi:hypothetical protein